MYSPERTAVPSSRISPASKRILFIAAERLSHSPPFRNEFLTGLPIGIVRVLWFIYVITLEPGFSLRTGEPRFQRRSERYAEIRQ